MHQIVEIYWKTYIYEKNKMKIYIWSFNVLFFPETNLNFNLTLIIKGHFYLRI